jgi:2-deoxy-D-gluconate 3-dehydrogenase
MSILDQFRLDGKTALVTGARRGIGLAIACALAEAGADIIATSASMDDDGGEVGRRVTAAGRRCVAWRHDLSDRAGVYALVERLSRHPAPIDILINNAGTIRRAPAAEHSDADWDHVINVNLHAPFILARQIGKSMIARRCGKIVFTASMLTFQGGITVPSYAASKGAVGQLVKALANEWAKFGVNVNAIAPGYIATDVTAPLQADAVRNKAILERIPAGRWGVGRDLAGAAVFLCSAASDYVHGTILTVDGGWMGR